MSKFSDALAIAVGDTVEFRSSWGPSYFHVDTVREASHPAAFGSVVWEGRYWQWRGETPAWGPVRIVHLWPNDVKGFRGIASASDVQVFGVPAN